ncbi:hypothetical protein DFP72DRAFT_916165 [Ephemerocybe angulata]|uniref:F-box domain-containing protein n=1 Tax=Ephemerocybe angulata TaxID=980116 RepID=A0A8H6HK51_9AGAR|nr:hypothetical protein DFP72DRAFT_916165 [Tulosesus angulatus]
MPGRNASISHLLDSNSPPKEVEIPFVESRIRDLLDRISELRKLEDELERHRSILSPVRKIPREVLGYIFAFLQPDEYDEKVRNARGRMELVNLSLVCKLWREAAFATHELWTGLQIKTRHSPKSFKSVEAWLSRSGSLARRLQYQGWYLESDDPGTFDNLQMCRCGDQDAWPRQEPRPCLLAMSVMPHLLTNGPPLDHLTLMCNDTECFQHFMEAMDSLRGENVAARPRPWDTLKSLSIKFRDASLQTGGHLGQTFISRFERIPRVQSLEVHLPSQSTFEYEFDPSHLELNILPNLIENLTTFTICCPWAGPHLLNLLPHCRNVETLTINFGNSGSALWGLEYHPLVRQYSVSPLVLSKLVTLRIRMGYNIDLLRILKAPRLVNLDISMFPREATKEEHLVLPVSTFLEQSGCIPNLRSFRLHACCIDAERLFYLLSSLPFLTSLTLDDVETSMHSLWKMFKNLDTNRGADLSFSNLEKLEVLQVAPDYQLNAVVDYLKARGPSLKFQFVASYKIQAPDVTEEKDIRQRLQFGNSGVQASVVPAVRHMYYL